MNCKDKIKMMLWNLGLRETIPASVINSVHIKENNEELVDIKQDKKLYFSDELQQRSAVYLRKSVYENIKKAQNALPNNYFFKVYSAFRPHEEQIQLWNKNYQEIKNISFTIIFPPKICYINLTKPVQDIDAEDLKKHSDERNKI